LNPDLTKRELDVLRATFNVDGDQRLAAHRLGISVCTLKTHLTRVYRKLMVNNLCGAFRVGLSLQMLDLQASVEASPPAYFLS
jgi:DNA-binding CsgD family transcriptional regulator